MRFAIFGSGGVGGYYGARLAAAGEDVTFVARGAHRDAIRSDGLRVTSISGDVHIRPARATDDASEIGHVDWVVCAVKAWQVPEAAAAMRPLLGPETAVLTLQNGVDAGDQIGAVAGNGRVVEGATWIMSFIEAPGHIRHAGVEPRIVLGERDGDTTARVADLRACWDSAGVKCEVAPDISAVLWEKFLFIAAVSGIGAVTRLPVGAYRDVPQSRRLLTAALEETAAVARAEGVKLPDKVVAKTLAFLDALAPESTASMQRDIADGRPSELEAQSGAVSRRGRRTGVATPVHDFLYASLLPLERRARGAN